MTMTTTANTMQPVWAKSVQQIGTPMTVMLSGAEGETLGKEGKEGKGSGRLTVFDMAKNPH